VRLLVLFDVDGTLFLTHDPLAGAALRETLEERFDVRLPEDAIEQGDHAGQTSLRIARLVLEAAAWTRLTSTRPWRSGARASPSGTRSSSRTPTQPGGAPHRTRSPRSSS
jgi:beta-phosphoglucomutase-like phosphatase (HAD superfamily)